jgi:hypothetical protein
MLTAFVIPLTVTGDRESTEVPSPNWPEPFSPQHRTVPFVNNAHECA